MGTRATHTNRKTLKEITVDTLEYIEDLWVKGYWLISAMFGVCTGILYYFGLISNIRNSLGNIITFASIIIGVLGVFLTLLITLQESPIFERLREYFPTIQKRLFIWLRSQMWTGIAVVLFSVVITIVPNLSNRLVKTVGCSIWGTLFWWMTLGSFYTVKLVSDLIIGNFSIPKRTPRK